MDLRLLTMRADRPFYVPVVVAVTAVARATVGIASQSALSIETRLWNLVPSFVATGIVVVVLTALVQALRRSRGSQARGRPLFATAAHRVPRPVLPRPSRRLTGRLSALGAKCRATAAYRASVGLAVSEPADRRLLWAGAGQRRRDGRAGRMLAAWMLLGWTLNGFAVPALAATPSCQGLPATIFGTNPQGEVITGTNGNDVIVGTPGPDTIYGLGGDDVICGVGGDDVIYGGPGNDTISGGDGNDRLYGGDGPPRGPASPTDRDSIDGGPGNDSIYAGAGDADLRGGAGDDHLYGGPGNDTLDGGPGNDYCDGDGGENTATNCEAVLNARRG